MAVLAAFSAGRAVAQTVSTVREAEFRSRWTDLQVDLRKEDDIGQPKTLRDKLRLGPIDLRGGMSIGWEYSNENLQTVQRNKAVRSSFFIAPTVGGLYEKELGSWKVSARYSVGWIFYLEKDYPPNSGDGNISQTFAVELVRTGDRLVVRSNTTGNYGSGYDIDRARQTKRLSLNEALSAEYQLTEFIRVGASTAYAYDDFSDVGNDRFNTGDTNSRVSGGVFLDDFLTDKTAVRLEVSAGQENRTSGGGASSSDRDYLQSVLRVNYTPTAKLAFTGSAGVGYLNDTVASAQDDNGLRAVYSLTSNYAPTDKTSASLYLGVEGSTAKPEVNLAISWRPRDTFSLRLSLYQQSGISLISTTSNQTSRGVLLTLQQLFFSRVNVGLSGGTEKTEYQDDNNSLLNSADPYTFASFNLGWQISEYLSLQLQLRTSSRRNASSTDQQGQQTRASMSLSLTF